LVHKLEVTDVQDDCDERPHLLLQPRERETERQIVAIERKGKGKKRKRKKVAIKEVSARRKIPPRAIVGGRDAIKKAAAAA